MQSHESDLRAGYMNQAPLIHKQEGIYKHVSGITRAIHPLNSPVAHEIVASGVDSENRQTVTHFVEFNDGGKPVHGGVRYTLGKSLEESRVSLGIQSPHEGISMSSIRDGIVRVFHRNPETGHTTEHTFDAFEPGKGDHRYMQLFRAIAHVWDSGFKHDLKTGRNRERYQDGYKMTDIDALAASGMLQEGRQIVGPGRDWRTWAVDKFKANILNRFKKENYGE